MKRRATGGQDHPQGLLDLKNEKDSTARHRHGCAKGGAGGASAYLLGADEVVAEAAGLLLGQHDNLDGLLGEALLERREAGEG